MPAGRYRPEHQCRRIFAVANSQRYRNHARCAGRIVPTAPTRDLPFSPAAASRPPSHALRDPAAEANFKSLTEQLPDARPDGVSFDVLFAETCNSTPSDSDKYRIALATLVQRKEIEIIGQDGKQRRSSTTIRPSEQLLPAKQKVFSFRFRPTEHRQAQMGQVSC